MSNPNEGAAWPIADAAMTQVCRIPFSLLASHRLTEMYRKSWTSSSLPATTASSRRVLTRLPSLCLVEPPRSVLYLHKTLSCITTQRTDESDPIGCRPCRRHDAPGHSPAHPSPVRGQEHPLRLRPLQGRPWPCLRCLPRCHCCCHHVQRGFRSDGPDPRSQGQGRETGHLEHLASGFEMGSSSAYLLQ